MLREKAFAGLQHQAVKMMKYTANNRAIPCLGNCVQVPFAWMDQARFDGNYVLGVVVQVTTGGNLGIATKAGVLKDCFPLPTSIGWTVLVTSESSMDWMVFFMSGKVYLE